jgi:hypothetical protein
MVALQLPGTWVMLLCSILFAWWRHDEGFGTLGAGTLIAATVLAILGEVVEFVAGAWGARHAGGSKRAALLAVVGGVVGAIVGTFALAMLPIIGTLLGAAVGAGVGSILGERWKGRQWKLALETGKGAAIGRFWGAAGKLAIAAAMWLLIAVAVLWPV